MLSFMCYHIAFLGEGFITFKIIAKVLSLINFLMFDLDMQSQSLLSGETFQTKMAIKFFGCFWLVTWWWINLLQLKIVMILIDLLSLGIYKNNVIDLHIVLISNNMMSDRSIIAPAYLLIKFDILMRTYHGWSQEHRAIHRTLNFHLFHYCT